MNWKWNSKKMNSYYHWLSEKWESNLILIYYLYTQKQTNTCCASLTLTHEDPRKAPQTQIPFSHSNPFISNSPFPHTHGSKTSNPLHLFLATLSLHCTRPRSRLHLRKDLSSTSHRRFNSQGSPWLRLRWPWPWIAVRSSQ